MLFDKVIAFDHLRQKICIIVNIKTDDVRENYKKALTDLDAIVSVIRNGKLPAGVKSNPNVQFECNVSKDEYYQMVERTKGYIRDGDIFQAVISRQFSSPYTGSLLDAYRMLRTTNPSPYMPGKMDILLFGKSAVTVLVCNFTKTLGSVMCLNEEQGCFWFQVLFLP